ncbi:MAG: class I SAM-dependent methyltransferase [Desulfobacteraceae bacterium]|nr:class I SAM-dependent methyltransferase [Desulfobacteraceae bacterium]
MKQEAQKNKKEFWKKATAKYDDRPTGFRDSYNSLAKMIARDVGDASRILDVGTGTGEMALAVAEKAAAVEGVDLTPEMIETAKAKAARKGCGNIRFSVQDASALEFSDNSFDAVIVSNLLHVIGTPDQVLREIHRVLIPGGMLVAPTFLHKETVVSLFLSLLYQVKGFPIHHRFSTKSLAGLINHSGFKVLSQTRLPGVMPLSHVVARALDGH